MSEFCKGFAFWMSAYFLLSALQFELPFNFTLNLMFQANRGGWSVWGVWGWEEKSSVAPFFLGLGENCMSWQVLSWFTSKSENYYNFHYTASWLLGMHLKDTEKKQGKHQSGFPKCSENFTFLRGEKYAPEPLPS